MGTLRNAIELLPYRFSFVAEEPVSFSEGRAGNSLRGAFGKILRSLVCVPPCKDPRYCDRRETCPYAFIFEPRALIQGPSGLVDRPRPFVMRAHHLDGRSVPAGELFHFDLHVFEVKRPLLKYFAQSFEQLAEEGIGLGRGRARLERVEALGLDGSPRRGSASSFTPLVLDLTPTIGAVPAVLVRFITPTEIKWRSGLVAPPDFAALFARVRDRLNSLSSLYGRGPLNIDFKGTGDRTREIVIARACIEHVSVKRLSSKTGQVHPIGGFTGEIEYRGALAEFVPYLRAARWTGLGRQTVWGNGVIEVHLI